jgi:hypothetical protein
MVINLRVSLENIHVDDGGEPDSLRSNKFAICIGDTLLITSEGTQVNIRPANRRPVPGGHKVLKVLER